MFLTSCLDRFARKAYELLELSTGLASVEQSRLYLDVAAQYASMASDIEWRELRKTDAEATRSNRPQLDRLPTSRDRSSQQVAATLRQFTETVNKWAKCAMTKHIAND